MQKQKTIPQLFEARAKAIEKATKHIFDAMPGAMEAINEMMGLEEIKKVGGDLIWEDLELVDDDVEEPMVGMVGVIIFPPGCELTTLEGDKVKVTVDTEPYFRRLTRAALPISIAVQTKEEVRAFFKLKHEEMKKQEELSKLDHLMQVEPEFDLSQLTEEQRAAYEVSVGYKPGKA